MRLSRVLWSVTVILAISPAVLARAGESTDINPALLYYRAILLTPEISAELSDADRQLILGSRIPDPSRDAASVARLIEAYNPTFQLLRQAAASEARCDWGTEILVNAQMLMPVRTRAKALCHAAFFRARHFLDADRHDDAVADLIAVWALARNLSAHGTFLSVRVRDSMEALLGEFVAEHFHRFDPETLRALAVDLGALPDRGSAADAVEPGKQRFIASQLRPLVQLRAELSGDDEAVLDCQDFRHHFRRRFLLENSNRGWALGQSRFTWPRLAWAGLAMIGAVLIVVWMLPRSESGIELAQKRNKQLPEAERKLVSAAIAGVGSQSRPIPTWMYYGDTLTPEALDQLYTVNGCARSRLRRRSTCPVSRKPDGHDAV